MSTSVCQYLLSYGRKFTLTDPVSYSAIFSYFFWKNIKHVEAYELNYVIYELRITYYSMVNKTGSLSLERTDLV